jgi:poly(glycerol-phosphate) alpha-glucosyltransferase
VNSILHVTSWLDARNGGIPPVIRALQREQIKAGWSARVAALSGPPVGDLPPGHADLVGATAGPAALGYSPELRRAVFSLQPRAGIVHTHGMWMYPGRLARKYAAATGAPLVISPHGMLEPWALQNSRWKKRLAGWLFENKNLRRAACLHALCAPEVESFRSFGLRNPVAVIPNGVDLTGFADPPPRSRIEARFPVLKGRNWILFLSRIHLKKGLPHLLRAWAAQRTKDGNNRNPSDWRLVIAGPDELGHTDEMRRLSGELKINDEIVFTGPLQGEEKMAALAGATAFVLPSFSEGFSMAILEAAAAGLPVLLTPQCNFPELARAGGGIEVDPNADSCAAGLKRLFAMSEAERRDMGARGRRLVTEQYTWAGQSARMLAVYRWLLGQGDRPDFVV